MNILWAVPYSPKADEERKALLPDRPGGRSLRILNRCGEKNKRARSEDLALIIWFIAAETTPGGTQEEYRQLPS